MSYAGMTALRAPGEKRRTGYGSRNTEASKEELEGHPSSPAYLLLVRGTVRTHNGYPVGLSTESIWNIYWSYDRAPWEAAVLKIETDNRNPTRYGKPTNYLAFKVDSVAAIETTIRMVG